MKYIFPSTFVENLDLNVIWYSYSLFASILISFILGYTKQSSPSCFMAYSKGLFVGFIKEIDLTMLSPKTQEN